jgi:glutamate/tyrosine decarboxylase-like PLP-dependent enzyme
MSRVGDLFDGMSSADSITCDPHKYLYVPYNCGSVLFADSARHTLLERFNEDGADYMYKTDEAQKQARADRPDYRTYLGSRRIEGSAGGSAAAALYTTIRHIGREGFASLLNHNLDMAEVFADEIRQKNGQLRLTFEPSLNTVCVEPADGPVGHAHPYANRVEDVSALLEKEFGIYLAAVALPNVDGKAKRKVFRFVATHPHTNENDVRYIADSLINSWENYNA